MGQQFTDQRQVMPSKSYNNIASTSMQCHHHVTSTLMRRCLSGTFPLGKFVCVDVLRPSQPNGIMSSAVSLRNHTFTGQA